MATQTTTQTTRTTTTTLPTTQKAISIPPSKSTWLNDNHDVKLPINYVTSERKVFTDANLPVCAYGEYVDTARMMTVRNARGKEDSFTLDRNGFEIHTLSAKNLDVSTDEKIVEDYYPQMEEFLKKVTGATHVFCSGHLLRRATNELTREETDKEQRYTRWVTSWPHSDLPVVDPQLVLRGRDINIQRVSSPERRAEAERFVAEGKRWMLIQTWRPLKTLRRDPLALCDALTYDLSDWRHRVYNIPGHPGNANLSHPEAEDKHQWYYMHEMTPDEMFVFKGCDSRMGEPGLTAYTGAHVSVVLPDSADKPPRESIENRFIAFWE